MAEIITILIMILIFPFIYRLSKFMSYLIINEYGYMMRDIEERWGKWRD